MAKETFLSMTAKTLPKLLPLLTSLNKKTRELEKNIKKLGVHSRTLKKSQDELLDTQAKLADKLSKANIKLEEQIQKSAEASKLHKESATHIDAHARKLTKYQKAIDGVRKSEMQMATQRFKLTTNYGGVRHGSHTYATGGAGFRVKYKDPRMDPENIQRTLEHMAKKRREHEKHQKLLRQQFDAAHKLKKEMEGVRLAQERAAKVAATKRWIAETKRFGRQLWALMKPIRAITNALLGIPRALTRGLGGVVGRLVSFFTYDLMNAIGRGVRSIPGFMAKNMQMAGDRASSLEMLTMLTKDPQLALKTLDRISSTAAKTPYTIRQARQNFTKVLQVMTASKMDKGENLDKVFELMKFFGDAAGGDQMRMNRVVTTMAQMLPRNKANEMDFRELANSLVDLKPILKDMLGLQKGDTLEATQVNAAMMIEAFRRYTTGGGPMAGAMDRQMKNWNGIVSNLKDIVQIFRENLGRPFIATFSGKLRKFVEMLSKDDMKDSVLKLGEKLTQASLVSLRMLGIDVSGNTIKEQMKNFGDSVVRMSLVTEDIFAWMMGNDSAARREFGAKFDQNGVRTGTYMTFWGWAFRELVELMVDGFKDIIPTAEVIGTKIKEAFGTVFKDIGKKILPDTKMDNLSLMGSGIVMAMTGAAKGNNMLFMTGLLAAMAGWSGDSLNQGEGTETPAPNQSTPEVSKSQALLNKLRKAKSNWGEMSASQKIIALGRYNNYRNMLKDGKIPFGQGLKHSENEFFRRKDTIENSIRLNEMLRKEQILNKRRLEEFQRNNKFKAQGASIMGEASDYFAYAYGSALSPTGRRGRGATIQIDQRNNIYTNEAADTVNERLQSQVLSIASADGRF